MYTTCRIFSHVDPLVDVILANHQEVESILRAVDGFRAYYVVRGDDTFVTITVCDTQAGAEESNARSAEWVRLRAGGLTGTKPLIIAGDTPLSFTG